MSGLILANLLAAFVLAAAGDDETSALAAAIARAPDGGEVVLASGDHFIRGLVPVQGKRSFTLRGEPGARLVVHVSRGNLLNDGNNALVVRDSEDFRLKGLAFSTDAPVNATGRIAGVDVRKGTFDVCLDGDEPFVGTEPVAGFDTCLPSGMPDRVLEMSGRLSQERNAQGVVEMRVIGVPYEFLPPRTLRFSRPYDGKYDLRKLTVGHRVVLRHSLWGGALMTFTDVKGARIEDVSVERCRMMAVVIGKGCRDFSFERFRIAPRKGSGALISSNADGIHALGLGGSLTLTDCEFRGLGDDAVNVHASLRKVGTEVPALAATERCYDPETFTLRDVPRPGDVILDRAAQPSVRIRRTTCRAMRARGFLLQTSDVAVEDCRFTDIGSAGVLCAPDAVKWLEGGPSENVRIAGCRFENCATTRSAGPQAAAVQFATDHGGGGNAPAGVHRNLMITGNRFVRCGGAAVGLTSVRTARVSGNVFENCSVRPEDADVPDVRIRLCEDVTVADNVTTKDKKRGAK